MKHLLIGTALALVTSVPAHAQQDIFLPSSDGAMILASDFIGMRVYAAEAAADADTYAGIQEGWDDIGEINDVILSRDGSIEAVLVDIGGFLGMGERQVAVDMSAIRFAADSSTADDDGDFFLVMNANRALLEGAPAYERGATGMPAADGSATPTQDTAAAEGTTTGTDTTTTAPMREGYAATTWDEITTEDLTGVNVYGSDEQSLGEISNFVLAEDNNISQVVVDVGGFLGIGAKPVAINAADLQVLRAEGDGALRAYVSMTREQIEQLPDAEL
ncbi:MAG: PRC-barrel domain-containing protein [Gemmobacter sp.]